MMKIAVSNRDEPSNRAQVDEKPKTKGIVHLLSQKYPKAEATLGFFYIWLSLASGIVYLHLLNPSFSNDLWWANYNLSGHQAFLIDISNLVVASTPSGTFDLLAPEATMLKNYSESVSHTSVYDTYARHLILNELTTPEYAVTNLRTLSASWSMRMCTQMCWIDFNRTFEIAHTLGRQKRCATNYAHNGAMYMEAILRNIEWKKYITAWGNYFTVAMQSGLQESPQGRAWIAATSVALASTTIPQELVYWAANEITIFQLQWLTRWSTGISETMIIENALGWQQQYTIKNAPRATGPWTTLQFFWLPYNDIWVIDIMNRSSIRGTSNYFGANVSASVPPVDIQTWSGFASASIPLPPGLVKLYQNFRANLASAIAAHPNLALAIAGLSLPPLDPTPPTWAGSNMLYYGGNPMCYSGSGLSYVQQSYDFYDACTVQQKFTFNLDPPSLLFSLYVSQISPADSCALTTSVDCPTALTKAKEILSYLPPVPTDLINSALTQVQVKKVQFMQYASKNGAAVLLRQPMLNEAAWNLFGWICLFDWAEGKREVVSFEGDFATLPLMSNAYKGNHISTSGSGEKLPNATQAIFYLMAYTSVLLVGIGLLCTVFGALIKLQVIGKNLFLFNRVVGSVYIGRPILTVRGLTAIGLLSTSQIVLTQANGYSRFSFTPRHWIATLIITSEATWLTYMVNDVLLLFANRLTPIYAPFSCYVVWFVYFVLEMVDPVQIRGTINRVCHSTNMDFSLNCQSGTVQIGSSQRVLTLFAIQAIVLVVTFVLSWLWAFRKQKYVTPLDLQAPLLISGTSDSFMERREQNGMWNIDKVSSIMCGLIPLSLYGKAATFDLKLWLVIPDAAPDSVNKSYHCPSLGLTATKANNRLTSSKQFAKEKKQIHMVRASALFGLGFILASVAGSISYIIVSQVNLANDLSWATFNITGAHAFMATWFNEQLVLGANDATLRLDNSSIVQMTQFNSPTASVNSPFNFGAMMQYSELNSELTQIISALRNMDACDIPWVFTQYCYVDFDKHWSTASTAARETRCKAMVDNAAVYLESFLRNINSAKFRVCWGDSFDTAFGNELQKTLTGRDWLNNIVQLQSQPLLVVDEAKHWSGAGMATYTTQWQNYKRIGLINSYFIQNALDEKFAFTLQHLNGSYSFSTQSTFKMYWALGTDLQLVMMNSSGIGGKSLIRTSSNYAYLNQTVESIMVLNATINSPFTNIFTATRGSLGPFGSVDMFYVVPPAAALKGIRDVLGAIRSAVSSSLSAQADFFSIQPIDAVRPVPKSWLAMNTNSFGGSLLCPQTGDSGDQRLLSGLINLVSYSIACSGNGVYTQVQPNREYITLSALLSGIATATSVDTTDICNQDTGHVNHCVSYLDEAFSFIRQHIAHLDSVAATSAEVKTIVQAMNIELMQFTSVNSSSTMTILHNNILNPLDPAFHFFGWWYLCDWVFGAREVISFQGDKNTMNVLSEYLAPYSQDVLPWQFPTTLATYARSGCQYVTVVMICVSVLVFVYIVVSRGYVEGFNMMELNRVGAIVWIGRPLLFLRSMTAITLLSTGTLELQYSGYASSFVVESNPWYKTWLAASEVTWLVSVVNDITMIITQEYTSYFITPNSSSVWIICALLSQLQPVEHSATINRVCTLVQVDYQIVCTSATVTIGELSRFLLLIYIVLGCNVMSFLLVRVFLPIKPTLSSSSLFLAAGAKFLFLESKWTFDDIYYLDRASAVLNGILTWRWQSHIYAFDIKVWRILAIQLPPDMLNYSTDVEPSKFAIPLTD
ncbi:hypothetical protein THRCLA_20299 [Thraustotheca clavata]|uniref:Uncharacterized protein n=1 Tax=Thraustotheca clavata TaxID=74557 RepID=A0A1W0A957_9STRA|nr:hypothetical protein THRCLA_20299 [Thraustotheca clavata]